MSHEEPTNEFRQVRHQSWDPILLDNGLSDYSKDWRKTLPYYTVQQKWLVYDGTTLQMGVWSQSNPESRVVREEWRDIPIVDDPKAP